MAFRLLFLCCGRGNNGPEREEIGGCHRPVQPGKREAAKGLKLTKKSYYLCIIWIKYANLETLKGENGIKSVRNRQKGNEEFVQIVGNTENGRNPVAGRMRLVYNENK